MIIDSRSMFVTQRKFPRMCLINTALNDDGLTISADGYGSCAVPEGGGQENHSSVWGTEVAGEDCGDQVAQWVSHFLGKECRVIYMHEDYSRPVDTAFATQQETVGFADGFPLLITTQASLDDFNVKLKQLNSDLEIGMERFRPNIVISGSVPWAEDQWNTISIGDIELSLVKPCSRCIMPSVNPNTAEKQMHVNTALMKHRRRDRKTYFGQNAVYNTLGRIGLGDSVTLLD